MRRQGIRVQVSDIGFGDGFGAQHSENLGFGGIGLRCHNSDKPDEVSHFVGLRGLGF